MIKSTFKEKIFKMLAWIGACICVFMLVVLFFFSSTIGKEIDNFMLWLNGW